MSAPPPRDGPSSQAGAALIPPLLVLTDGQNCGGRPLTEVVAAAIDGGARAVLLREKHLAGPERHALAVELSGLLEAVGGLLLVASDPTIPAGGVHLAAADPFPGGPLPGRLSSRGAGAGGVSGGEGGGGRLVGRSCHSRTDVARAAGEGCDYATLSPIHLTESKPGYGPALGTAALTGLPLPTWALGGVEPANAAACLGAGASGVAVMGAVMRAPDPGKMVALLLEALEVA
ncbi:MAG: thiamine phosphate synthase [Acidimicrobiaceae bacterium]|nr:thiamine phosphate synthase [Acidimicrobiaceae bacterium]